MTSNKLGVCVIGAGRAGRIHAVNFAKGIKNARLTAIAEPNRDTAEQACREIEIDRHYQDYRQALEDDAGLPQRYCGCCGRCRQTHSMRKAHGDDCRGMR